MGNKTLKKGGNCNCSKKLFSGGSVVTPELSGYKMNEGIGGMNDPHTNIVSSRLVVGGKKSKRRRKTMRKKRNAKSKKTRK
jgi:hypothetical protein